MKRILNLYIISFALFFCSANAQNILPSSSSRQQVSTNNAINASRSLINFPVILPASVGSSQKKALSSNGLSGSLLTSGYWYKLGITNDGIYKIDYAMLKKMGIDPASVIPSNIHIYGKGGGMLPQANSAPRDNDLVENAIQVVSSGAAFGSGDYILFYAKGPTSWTYDSVHHFFHHQANYYADTAYYFFNVSSLPGKRINTISTLTSSSPNIVTTYDAHDYHELDQVTDLSSYVKSGREWYGEQFSQVIDYDFNNFNYPYLDTSKPVKLYSRVAGHYLTNTTFTIGINDASFTQTMASITENWEQAYASISANTYSCKTTSTNIDVHYHYNQPDITAEAWLDFFELNVRCSISYASGQLSFRDASSLLKGGVNQYQISGNSNPQQVWDVTDFHNVVNQGLNSSGTSFNADASTLHEYVAFDGTAFLTPGLFGQIPNQNLHGSATADMIIIASPDFLDAANQLAAFHQTHDGISSIVVTPQQIYNEFSYGSQDVSAIRDFVRYVYNKAGAQFLPKPRYLLLFGDGSHDYKNHYANNSNYVPTYESYNSTEPQSSYASDAYFGFVDSAGGWTSYTDGNGVLQDGDAQDNDTLALSIGRVPVETAQQAQDFVNKLKRYYSPQARGAWRNVFTFIADSYAPDGNLHEDSSDQMAKAVEAENPVLNINKIYLDAFPLVSDNTGLSVPGAELAINQKVDAGTLVLNYIGHGDEVQLSHDDVLNISDINSWTNTYAMPLFMTATCQFGQFDDPETITASETALLKPDGGVIALYTACRVAESSDNYNLGINIFTNNLFRKTNCRYPTIGEAFKVGQNLSTFTQNTRCFVLLGDPAMTLNIPENNIVTDTLVTLSGNSDTMKALCTMKLTGHVADCSGNTMTDFNAKIFPLIYDKELSLQTLGNDASTPKITYKEYKSVIYSGQDSIKNGRFSIEFVVPKDINYIYGKGKISYYAANGVTDAHGYDDSAVIGGACPNAPIDTAPPVISLFMNDTHFVSGGLVNDQPLLIAGLSDKLGIDVSTSAVGHQITAMLNDSGPIILNEYYQSEAGDYRKGVVNYKFLNSLPNGTYHLTLKVWNVADISSEASIDFVVASSSTLAISNSMNFPNPFSSTTTFQFEHNQPNQDLQLSIDIYSLQGKLVHTITDVINSPGTRSVAIQWNGDDGSGARLANGIYLYRLTVKTPDGQQASLSQKLVIMHN